MLARAMSHRSVPAVVALAVTVASTIALSISSSTPSIWYDEAATISGAQRSFYQLGALLSHVDAVHGAYYVFMHLWLGVFGYSPLTLRMPSVLASGVTAGLLVLLGWRIDRLRTGVIAALIFAVLPRTTYAAAQGRSYAIATLLVTAATLVIVVAVQQTGGKRSATLLWIAYGALISLSIVVFVYAALILIAHAAFVARHRRTWVPWSVAALASVLLAAPVVLVAAGQTGQVGWLQSPTLNDLVVEPWSTQNGVMAGAVLAAAAAGTVVAWRQNHSAALLLVTWAVGPILIVAAVSLIHPLYYARYVGFTTPAATLLVGAAVAAARFRAAAIVAVVAAAALSLPTWISQRQPTANDGHNWQSVAAIVEQQRQDGTGTEVAIYGPLQKREAVTTRLIASAYPAAFEGMRDLTITKTGAQAGTLWAETAEPVSRVNRLSTADSVWIISAQDVHLKDKLAPLLNSRGFSVDGYWTADGAEIARYVRR